MKTTLAALLVLMLAEGASAQGTSNLPYTIRRRPVPVPGARAVTLPAGVVIDLTTWGLTRERSRLPVDLFTGTVDILVNPDGSVVPTTIYSSPASVGLDGAFLHFWLAERNDVVPVRTDANGQPVNLTPGATQLLPIGRIDQRTEAEGLAAGAPPYTGPSLRGEYRLVTVFARTGQVSSAESPAFDSPTAANRTGRAYNPSLPFRESQQGR